ncbi:hypothetical protein JOD43_000610 [Pullulanibacillus pueri]|uniref:Uncharacterized protein n=1 Tax=Pullulanibacillus pueri TaxID=1437324 RepID=A0A8J3EL39_9BACL|nr:hypothetical protein [Pullulanibacillus pueri]MBM7680451.1 hypothetical protein [Pullulanibacillus pueri]GGH75023.1 hypothetical protein GCM10007096_03810 [Pullulanibacillus pueri]
MGSENRQIKLMSEEIFSEMTRFGSEVEKYNKEDLIYVIDHLCRVVKALTDEGMSRHSKSYAVSKMEIARDTIKHYNEKHLAT